MTNNRADDIMTQAMTGGCQCGRVRYRYACHCRECQKQSASAFGLSVPVPSADLTVQGDVGCYERQADSGAKTACSKGRSCRPHCIGSDDPKRFTPKFHFGVETRLDQWLDTSALPGYRIEDNPYTVTRWIKAIGKLPD
jgi:hypothetical protein